MFGYKPWAETNPPSHQLEIIQAELKIILRSVRPQHACICDFRRVGTLPSQVEIQYFSGRLQFRRLVSKSEVGSVMEIGELGLFERNLFLVTECDFL